MTGLGDFGRELSGISSFVVDQVLADVVPVRWLVSRTPREGDVLEFRPFDGDLGDLMSAATIREKPSGQEALVEGIVRPEPRKARVSAVDRSSGLVRYRLELERDGGPEHCEVDERGRMSRLTHRIDEQLEEWVAEPKEAAILPFDPGGRYRAGFSFAAPADGPNLVEALSIWVPTALLPLVDRKTLNVSESGRGAVITLPPGERALTDDDRTSWGAAIGPMPPSPIRAWATEVAGAGTTRDRLGRLRDAVEAIQELDPWARAQRLAEGARSVGIACRIVEGHAITDRSGTFMTPHAWIEAIDGDRVVAVDPASVRIPAPPTRLPMRIPDAALRTSLTECCVEIGVVSMKLRDVGIPDLKRGGSSAWRKSRDSKGGIVQTVVDAAPDLFIQKPDEIDVPEKVAPGTEELYRMLPADAEILRDVVARDRWDASDVGSLREVAERLSKFPDPLAIDLSSPSIESRRAAALAMGKWMAAQVRRREVYVLLMPSLVKLGPYVGVAAPADVVLEQPTESQKLAGLDVTLGVADIGGAKQAVVQAKRDGVPVWARAICAPGRFPIGRPRWAPNPSADLGGLGFRLHIRAATGAHVYLGPDGSFQFYILNPFR